MKQGAKPVCGTLIVCTLHSLSPILIKFGRGAMNMYMQPEARVACIQHVQAPLINSHSQRLATVWLRAYQISRGTPFIFTAADTDCYPTNANNTIHLSRAVDKIKSSCFARLRVSLCCCHHGTTPEQSDIIIIFQTSLEVRPSSRFRLPPSVLRLALGEISAFNKFRDLQIN